MEKGSDYIQPDISYNHPMKIKTLLKTDYFKLG